MSESPSKHIPRLHAGCEIVEMQRAVRRPLLGGAQTRQRLTAAVTATGTATATGTSADTGTRASTADVAAATGALLTATATATGTTAIATATGTLLTATGSICRRQFDRCRQQRHRHRTVRGPRETHPSLWLKIKRGGVDKVERSELVHLRGRERHFAKLAAA